MKSLLSVLRANALKLMVYVAVIITAWATALAYSVFFSFSGTTSNEKAQIGLHYGPLFAFFLVYLYFLFPFKGKTDYTNVVKLSVLFGVYQMLEHQIIGAIIFGMAILLLIHLEGRLFKRSKETPPESA